MKNKGFTLIELLAVIIILAIIALIAVPTILNIIENSKKKALENTAYGMIRAGEYYYLEHSNETYPKTFTGPNYEGLEFKGKKVEGSLTISPDGKISINICDDGYCATKGADESLVTVGKSSETTVYSVGDAVYYNPETGTSCDNYTSSQSTGTAKTGCLKWYIINDGGATIDVLLDHNTTYNVKWNNSGDNAEGPVIANNQLASDVSGWVAEAKNSARLISADEVWEITQSTNGASGWNSATSTASFYFEGSELSGQGTSNYSWLFDYTNTCTSYGCNTKNDGTYGYWTLSPVVDRSDVAWYVCGFGELCYYSVGAFDENVGVRPVITISKSGLS